jgi:D-amino-acid dehydrogenase
MNESKREVVVVGGGVVGLCSALYLARAGVDVAVLSRDPEGKGASAGNAGMLVPSHVVPLSSPGVIAQGLRWMMRPDAPFHLRMRPSLDLLRWLRLFQAHCTRRHVDYAAPILRDLSLASVRLYGELAGERDDFALDAGGLLMIYRGDAARTAARHEADVADAVGLEVRDLDAAALQELDPGHRTEAAGAVYYPGDGRVDPDLLLFSLAARLREAGVPLRYDTEVSAVEARSDGLTVRTRDGDIRTERVVLACGAWTPHLVSGMGARLPVEPAKGYSITIPAPREGPSIPAILLDERVTITPMPGRLRFGGTLSLSGLDPDVDPVRAGPIRREALRYADPATVDENPVWSGFRPASPDGLPIVGYLAPDSRVLVATGHGMMGVTLGAVTGHIVADIVAERAPIVDPHPFAPTRFG